jgi:hypothetical protein
MQSQELVKSFFQICSFFGEMDGCVACDCVKMNPIA